MKNLLFFFVSIAILSSSCVSQKKYQDLESSKSKLQQEISKLQRSLKDCEKMELAKAELQTEYDELTVKQNELQTRIKNLKKVNDDQLANYDELLAQNSTILTSSSKEKKNLSEELAQNEARLNKKEAELRNIEKELKAQQSELNRLKLSLEDREASIASLNAQLEAQRNGLNSLKSKLTNALLGFSAADLTVTQKDGKVYVSMSQNLLFAKGSNLIDTKGKDAIQKVAVVLAQNSDIDITVEGHTDSDGTAERNWDLSVTRATAVVNLMTKYGVDPKSIIASGRAYYVPIAANDIEENKAKNRRTEIILSPRLSELYRLLNE